MGSLETSWQGGTMEGFGVFTYKKSLDHAQCWTLVPADISIEKHHFRDG